MQGWSPNGDQPICVYSPFYEILFQRNVMKEETLHIKPLEAPRFRQFDLKKKFRLSESVIQGLLFFSVFLLNCPILESLIAFCGWVSKGMEIFE